MDQSFTSLRPISGIKAKCHCFENVFSSAVASIDVNKERAMKKAMYATLAFAAAVAFAGPAFAEKFKATLDGKTEVPPNASKGSGTADIDYDPATKKLTWT